MKFVRSKAEQINAMFSKQQQTTQEQAAALGGIQKQPSEG